QGFHTWPHLRPALASFSDAALAGASRPFFTYHSTTHQMHARLDYVFLNLRHTSLSLSTTIIPYPRSDHDTVCVTFSHSSSSSYPVWRYNTSLLSSSDFCSATSDQLSSYVSPTRWDASKYLASSTARDFALVASRKRQSTVGNLERRIAAAQHRAARQISDHQAAALVQDLRQQLDDVIAQASSRATLRARIRWLEEGETCSAYFFSRFRSRSSSATLSVLCDNNGQSFSSVADRHAYILSYFSSVFASPSVSSSNISSFLSSLSFPSLPASTASFLLSPISVDELRSTIRALPPCRAPGPDGIPYEWYQTFSEDLIPILLPLFNGILSGNPPPPFWTQTMISLIPKPDRNLLHLSNWRPITLSNCDCKIFSRLLASQLTTALPSLIGINQCGFIRDRQAADVAMAIRAVLGYAASNVVDGALLLLDQEKAYDRISHPFLFVVLDAFGFPPLLQQAFASTFTNSYTSILDDGVLVGPIAVGVGVCQG